MTTDKKVAQSISWSVLQQRKISRRLIASLDILITLKLYEVAGLHSGTELCLHDQIHFQTQPRYMVCKNALSGRTFEHWN